MSSLWRYLRFVETRLPRVLGLVIHVHLERLLVRHVPVDAQPVPGVLGPVEHILGFGIQPNLAPICSNQWHAPE